MANKDSKWNTLLAGGLIVLAGLVAYSNSFQGAFIFDDFNAISNNLTIRHLWRSDVLLSPSRQNGGRPILNISFALTYAFCGLHVWGYHATNLVIHWINGLLLLGILRRTFLLPTLRSIFGRDALLLASAIALLWVVHPLQTQAVAYMVQRAESLGTMFYLLTLYAVIRGAQSGQAIWWFGLAVAACWLGVAAKEIVVTVPVVVLCYDRTFLAGTFRQAWRQRWGLYLGLAASWLLTVTLVLAFVRYDDRAGFGYGMTSWEYAATQGGAILHYVRLALWPTGLNLHYGNFVARTSAEILPGAMFVLVLIGLTGWAWKCRNGLGFLGVFFLATLAPSSSFVPIVDETLAERRMYLPLAAVITFLVICGYQIGQRWLVRGRLAIGLCLVILVATLLGALTFRRNFDYRSELAIWKDEVAKGPDNPLAFNNWGTNLLDAGRPAEAIEHFEKALQIKPDFPLVQLSWGIALVALDRPAEAIEHFQETLRLNPDDADAHNNWGYALSMQGRSAEAIEHFEKALRLKPNYPLAQVNWGIALLALNRPTEAIEHFKKALQLQPDFADAHNNWGGTLLALSQPAEAIEHLQEAVRLKPNYVDAQYNLANALAQTGHLQESIEYYRQAIQSRPNADIYTNLGNALAMLGRLPEAIECYQQALRMNPKHTTAQRNLSIALKQAGQNATAEEINQRGQLDHDQKSYRQP